jgi:hypothetical protein
MSKSFLGGFIVVYVNHKFDNSNLDLNVMIPQAVGSEGNDINCDQLPRQQNDVSRDLQSALSLR